MSTSLLDSACDAHASITTHSPDKGLFSASEPKLESIKPKGTAEPSVEDVSSLSPSKPSASIDISNEVLIHKLLESLESLKTQDSRTNSGTTSPSPLTISTGGSADPIPSSPTDNLYDFSPVGPLTREHSTDSLAAAVQHLSLGQHRRPAVSATPVLHNTPNPNITLAGFRNSISGTTTQTSNNTTWSNPTTTTAATTAAGGPATPLQMPSFHLPQTQQAQHAGLFSTSSAATATGGMNLGASLPTAQAYTAANTHGNLAFPATTAAGVVGAATGGAQLAGYQNVYSDQLARAQAQMQLFRMLSPPPAPVYEECLVGIDGAYQNYCHQVINNEINVAALRMLSHVKAAQLTDPPAVARLIGKRYFCSLKEVSKVVGASSMLLIAPDVRPSITAHIKPVRLLQMVMAAADAAGVPYVFCLSRRGIGQVFGRDKSMSIVAVMHVDGVENEYVTLLEQAAKGRELYAMHRRGQNNNNNVNNNMNSNDIDGIGGGYSYTGTGFNCYGQQHQQQANLMQRQSPVHQHQQRHQHHQTQHQQYDSYQSQAHSQFNFNPHGYQGSY